MPERSIVINTPQLKIYRENFLGAVTFCYTQNSRRQAGIRCRFHNITQGAA